MSLAFDNSTQKAIQTFTASTTPTAITLPTCADGDLIQILIFQDRTTNGLNTPSGFTSIFAVNNYVIFYKIAGSSEPNPSITSTGSSFQCIAITTCITGADPVTPINVSAEGTASGGSNWTTQDITTTVDDCIKFAGGGTDGGTSDWLAGDEPSSITMIDQAAGTSMWVGLGFRTLGAAGATGTETPWENQSGSKKRFAWAVAPAVASVTIDDTDTDTRVTETRTVRVTVPVTAPTTGNTSIYINADTNAAITPTSCTLVSGLTYDIAFTVPDEYAGLRYDSTGYPIIVDTVDGQATSANVPYLPVTGNDFVNPTVAVPGDIVVLSGTFGTDDQLEYETAGGTISISTSCIITYTGGNPAGVSFDIRAWDNADDTWGSFATMSFGGEAGTSNYTTGVIVRGIINNGVIL